MNTHHTNSSFCSIRTTIQATIVLLAAGGAGGGVAYGSAPTALMSAVFGATAPKTLVVASHSNPGFLNAAATLNAPRCIVIYQSLGETGGKYNETKLRTSVLTYVPADYTGYALLDFEGHWLKYLDSEPGTPTFATGETALKRVVEVARDARPAAKWSVYGLPALRYFSRDAKGATVGWHRTTPAFKETAFAKGARCAGVVALCDWVAPSVYDPYLDIRSKECRPAQIAYTTMKTELAVQLAKGKPVLPVIWHRVHDSNKVDGLTLLSDDEFISGQVRPALAAGAAGVIWWGADSYSVRVGSLQARQPAEFSGIPLDRVDLLQEAVLAEHMRRLRVLSLNFG